jgi:hypothetical protein
MVKFGILFTQLPDEVVEIILNVNYCLKSLAEKGLIKIKRFLKSEHKIGYIYIMTLERLKKKSLMTIDFLRQKLAEYEALQDEISSLKDELEVTRGIVKQMDLTFDNGHYQPQGPGAPK